MQLLIASNNKHKIEEIKQILNSKFEKIVSLQEANVNCDPEENGATFLQNALIKAYAVSKLTNMAVLADDTGLCVNDLNGEPGVHSARYAGDHDNAKNRQKLLQQLQGKQDRSAYFCTSVVLLYPDGRLLTATGKVEGKILLQEEGDNGFGYDCLFWCNELGKCFGNATSQEKNQFSHRGKALQNLLQML